MVACGTGMSEVVLQSNLIVNEGAENSPPTKNIQRTAILWSETDNDEEVKK